MTNESGAMSPRVNCSSRLCVSVINETSNSRQLTFLFICMWDSPFCRTIHVRELVKYALKTLDFTQSCTLITAACCDGCSDSEIAA